MSRVVPKFWAGIDWSENFNDVAVVNVAGTVVARARVRETPAGVKEVLRLLAGVKRGHDHSRKQVPIAIESNRGLLVEGLRAAGQPLIAMNPVTVSHYRRRMSPAIVKSDRGDAALLAQILRIDLDRHRVMPSNTAAAEVIKELSRLQRHAGAARRRSCNQLRSALRDVHPAACEAWSELPNNLLRAEARAVLALAPTPSTAARVPRRLLRDALIQAGRTRLITAHTDRLFALFREPVIRYRPDVEAAHAVRIQHYVQHLNLTCEHYAEATTHLQDAFSAHPQAPIYLSFPGVGPIIGARLLGEIGDDPDRFTTARGLTAYAGAAPVTWASSTSTMVRHRRAANKVLLSTGHHWAFSTLTRSPECREHYDHRRAKGDRHAAALRHLANKLLRSLHHCLATGTHYNAARAFPSTPLRAHE